MPILGHGIDIVETARIRPPVEQHGHHFPDRVFTPAEQAHCALHPKRYFDHLPARPSRHLPAGLFALTFLATAAAPSFGWERFDYEDWDVVERSQLIVVGRLKPESIERVPHSHKPDEGASWEHHALLLVDEVLKGKVVVKEMPVVIHYGLDPVKSNRPVREQRNEPAGGGPGKAEGPERID